MLRAFLLISSRILVAIGAGSLVGLLPLSEQFDYSSFLPFLKNILFHVQSSMSLNDFLSSLLPKLDNVLHFTPTPTSPSRLSTLQLPTEFSSYRLPSISFTQPSPYLLLNSILFYLIVFCLPSSVDQSLSGLPGLQTHSDHDRKSTYICSWVEGGTSNHLPMSNSLTSKQAQNMADSELSLPVTC